MGKLNIAHHKSYHPYRRDNIERVRQDEEEARLKEAAQDGKIALADAEARIELLRQRAGLGKAKAGSSRTEAAGIASRVEDQPRAGPSSLMSGGHINLFEDFERQSLPVSVRTTSKADASAPTEQGVPLAPSEKDRKPWYSEREHGPPKELDGAKQTRELARKSAHDPLTTINRRLAQRPGEAGGSASRSRPVQRRQLSPRASSSSQQPEVAERLNRESSERQRALELIRRRKREAEGSVTPSTRSGMTGGYGDVFNRREVEDARRHRKWEIRHPDDDRRDRRW